MDTEGEGPGSSITPPAWRGSQNPSMRVVVMLHYNNNLFVVVTTPRLSLTCPRNLPIIPRLHDWLNRPPLTYGSMELVRMLAGPSLPWSISTHTLKHLIRLGRWALEDESRD